MTKIKFRDCYLLEDVKQLIVPFLLEKDFKEFLRDLKEDVTYYISDDGSEYNEFVFMKSVDKFIVVIFPSEEIVYIEKSDFEKIIREAFVFYHNNRALF